MSMNDKELPSVGWNVSSGSQTRLSSLSCCGLTGHLDGLYCVERRGQAADVRPGNQKLQPSIYSTHCKLTNSQHQHHHSAELFF
jgi:hypothetical protein